MIDLDIQGKISFKSQVLPNSELKVCPPNYSSPVQAKIIKFEPEVQNNLVKILVVLGAISILSDGPDCYTVSTLSPLHVCWSRQLRVIWHLTSLFFNCSVIVLPQVCLNSASLWRINTSVNWVIIGPVNSLTPITVCQQAITWDKTCYWSGPKSHWKLKLMFFHEGTVFFRKQNVCLYSRLSIYQGHI